MKKSITLISFVLIVLFSAFVKISGTPDEAKKQVETYLSSLKNIAETSDPNACSDAVVASKDIFAFSNESDEFPIPDDLSENSNSCDQIPLIAYLRKFYKESQKGFSYDYKIGMVKSDDSPGFVNNEPTHYAIVVTQTINGISSKNIFKIEIKTNKICNIKSSVCIQDNAKLKYKALLAEAADDFTHGNYDAAYQKYLQIIDIEYDGDAYYRLGVMTFKGLGCSNLTKKERMRKTDEYLLAAKKYGDSDIRKKAQHMYERVNM